MSIQFTKMHGLGNDFMVVDAISQTINFTQHDIQALSRRDTGIGFDQCLILEASKRSDVDFFYRIFNSNGLEVGQCGNGARCIGQFIAHYKLSGKRAITLATKTTEMQLYLNIDKSVTVNMGAPQWLPPQIPLLYETQETLYPIPCGQHIEVVHALSVGNPHAVIVVDDVQNAPVESIGQQISEHALFPEQTNVGFMQIISPKHIKLRVYERGCAETRACGSGAVAAVAAGCLYHGLDAQVTVTLPGGVLTIDWPEKKGSIFLTGPATFVYEGQLMQD
jgi:diaminopimelate epimerase